MYSLVLNIAMYILRLLGKKNEKLRLFVEGRDNLIPRIKEACSGYDDIIWFHTPSYGDFEEARPIIDATRTRYPDAKILLTFFSPSGYEMRKNYKNVDWVFYLPIDTRRNMREFLDAVRPKKAIFTIGEYWFNTLKELRNRKIDTYVMSIRILPNSTYLKWYAFPFRNLFRTCYKNIIVKDERSVDILSRIGAKGVVHIGDARFDRVFDIAAEPWNDPIVDSWCGEEKVFIAGSSCPGGDDDIVLACAAKHQDKKFLFIPHEIHKSVNDHIIEEAKAGAVLYSEVQSGNVSEERLRNAQILIIDKVGMLARLYRYGFAAFIGGGFINMPHSVIEPAVYGLPDAMGPQYERDLHFVDMVKDGCGFSFEDADSFNLWYEKISSDREYLATIGKIASSYCESNRGATDKIMNLIFES
ncbi:MAG: hypothetical protein MJZ16_09960 [Bacteroidales bacterium]|nr:hypothetical protein [Bacteroidales bacterium]